MIIKFGVTNSHWKKIDKIQESEKLNDYTYVIESVNMDSSSRDSAKIQIKTIKNLVDALNLMKGELAAELDAVKAGLGKLFTDQYKKEITTDSLQKFFTKSLIKEYKGILYLGYKAVTDDSGIELSIKSSSILIRFYDTSRLKDAPKYFRLSSTSLQDSEVTPREILRFQLDGKPVKTKDLDPEDFMKFE